MTAAEEFAAGLADLKCPFCGGVLFAERLIDLGSGWHQLPIVRLHVELVPSTGVADAKLHLDGVADPWASERHGCRKPIIARKSY